MIIILQNVFRNKCLVGADSANACVSNFNLPGQGAETFIDVWYFIWILFYYVVSVFCRFFFLSEMCLIPSAGDQFRLCLAGRVLHRKHSFAASAFNFPSGNYPSNEDSDV